MSGRFDIVETPARPGTTLLEASAGTGKTYAIAGLFVRHLVADRLDVDGPLVVTFTRAATAELRGRIRALLGRARRVAEGRDDGTAGAEGDLVRRILGRHGGADAARRLSRALEDFDRAAIHTIDGFCQRLLGEHAFATRSLPDAEFLADAREACMSVVDDFWRERFHGPDGELRGRLAEAAGLSPEHLQALGRDVLRHAECGVLPVSGAETVALRLRMEAAARERPATGGALPAEQALEWAAALRAELASTLRPRLAAALERERRLTFGDLRAKVAAALDGPHGDALARAVRARHRVALIDEFQDTDPVQFRMFRRLFGEPDAGTPLYLVGDPKQAIYGFRGADIHAYLEASAGAERRFTLPDNRRSESRLVEAVNHVFGRGGAAANPFAIPAIRFEPVNARGAADLTPFVEAGRRRPPLRIAYWRPDDTASTKASQQARIARRVAREIAALLGDPRTGFLDASGGVTRPCAGYVAVLVNRHDEAALVADALRSLGIASVRNTQERIFSARAAGELLAILRALASPGDERAARAAAVTSPFGWDAADLDAVAGSPARWLDLVQALRRAGDAWTRRGVMAAWEAVLAMPDARARVLGPADGERRFTDFLHLAERLRCIESAERLGPLALADRLAREIADPSAEDDEELLRLDRDDDAVKLVTIHSCKGLEYPVVFCPFLLEPAAGRAGKEDAVVFHDPDDAMRLKIDVGGPDHAAHAAAMRGEQFAERLRLTYVALTRARHRCHVVWGPLARKNAGAEQSPLAWLLHPPGDAARLAADKLLDALKQRLKSDKVFLDLRPEVEALAAGAPEAVEIVEFDDLPAAAAPPAADPAPVTSIRARDFGGALEDDHRVTSYTALAGGGHGRPSREIEPETPPAGPEAAPDPFRGAAAGNVLHAVMERLPALNDVEGELPGLVAARLEAEGFHAPALTGRVVAMVRAALETPLAAYSGDAFAPGSIPMESWRVEAPFHLPLRRIDPAALSRLVAEHGRPGIREAWSEALAALGFDPVRGYLTGKIDLVFRRGDRFHLVDWKSNVLGPEPEDYGPGPVAAAMLRAQYLLQYHLYLLALDRHLGRVLPGYDYDRHMGGAWYLFVRGMDPAAPGRGVFHDRPTAEFMRRLAEQVVDDRAG